MDAVDDYYFALPIVEFCYRAGIGQTLCREMIRDGRLRAVRAGKKKLLVDVSSWREYVRDQALNGVPEYTTTEAAIAVRKAKRAAEKRDGVVKPVVGAPVKPAEALAMTLSDLGLA